MWMMQEQFPVMFQKVYILQPSSFIQKKFTDNSLKFLKDDIKFKVYSSIVIFYLRQGGYFFTCVCLSVCLSVTGLLTSYSSDIYEIFRNGRA